jgi:hypothetical protein
MAAQISDIDMGKRRDGAQVQVVTAPAFGDEDRCQQQVPQPAAQALIKHHDSRGERAGWKGEILRAIQTLHAAVWALMAWISGTDGRVYSSLDLSSFSLYMNRIQCLKTSRLGSVSRFTLMQHNNHGSFVLHLLQVIEAFCVGLFLGGWLSLLRTHRHLILQVRERRPDKTAIHVVFVGLLISESWSVHKFDGGGTLEKGFFSRAGFDEF